MFAKSWQEINLDLFFIDRIPMKWSIGPLGCQTHPFIYLSIHTSIYTLLQFSCHFVFSTSCGLSLQPVSSECVCVCGSISSPCVAGFCFCHGSTHREQLINCERLKWNRHIDGAWWLLDPAHALTMQWYIKAGVGNLFQKHFSFFTSQ